MRKSRPGLMVYLQVKPGKQGELMEFLKKGLNVVAEETGTQTWYAFQITDDKFGIYDTFTDNKARESHLSGQLAQALDEVKDDLLAAPPEVREIDILAAKPAWTM